MLRKERVSEFAKLPWHDAKLLAVRVFRDEVANQDNLSCTIDFETIRNSWHRALVLFQNCTLAKINIDLDGKKICADSISRATCEIDSSLKKSLEEEQLKSERSPLLDYYHFHIALVPPGGELNVFAKDFDINWIN